MSDGSRTVLFHLPGILGKKLKLLHYSKAQVILGTIPKIVLQVKSTGLQIEGTPPPQCPAQ